MPAPPPHTAHFISLLFLKSGRESGFFRSLCQRDMPGRITVQEVDFRHSAKAREERATGTSHLWQSYNFLLRKKEIENLILRVKRFIVKLKHFMDVKEVLRKKVFGWAEVLGAFRSNPGISRVLYLPSWGQMRKLAIWLGIGEPMNYRTRWGRTRPSLDFHVRRLRFKVLLKVVAKIPSHPGFSSWASL